MHSENEISVSKPTLAENIVEDFRNWESVISKNWERQKINKKLNGNLVRFWDVVTPYAKAVD
ncbi:hypothetical protein M5C90_03680 [Pseudomonas chlororaphis subsp. piscium]|nr:hypothetical protein M5C90_03680 [Pseudomonas chlororaphis subsp. piscium]